MTDPAAPEIQVVPAQRRDAKVVAALTGLLLDEISQTMGTPLFDFDIERATRLLESRLGTPGFVVLIAQIGESPAGFATANESFAVYAGGVFGTITELFATPDHRGRGVGRRLIESLQAVARDRGWQRLEVTTPPLPAFDRTLAFYEKQGFWITGGRKLKYACVP